ncbi:Ras-related protein Rap-1b [Thelohanellus kitauei]|uniref:Ras-related protein Rap-1b n=1 Tax=Thelohanellus kitauei TaxID=669202 RepID=A0A0C2MM89_THEKT|nr:Ras-related protein Rap-1b [Thelohanellus kitauei]
MGDINIVVMGPAGVGKSCTTTRFVQDKFIEKYDPTIEDSYRKEVTVGGKSVLLEILDTAGTEQFSALRNLYVKNGNAFMLVYSVPIIIVGNKCDMVNERVVSTEKGKKFAESNNLLFMEISAKDNINVTQAFMALVEKIYAKGQPQKKKKSTGCHVL